MDQHGAIRIGSTHVLLETVVRAFEHGETPEGIVQALPISINESCFQYP